MAQQTIGLGTVANDGTGDPLRTGGQKINANFTELYGIAYVTIGASTPLTAERALAVGSSLALADGGAGSSVTLSRAALTGDVTASADSNATTIANDVVTYAKMQNVSATQRVLGRNTAGAGDVEEVSASGVLDWIGSTQGQILYRGASSWSVLSAGTAGQVLQTGGAGANPSWTDSSPIGASYLTLSTNSTLTSERVLTMGSNLSPGMTGTDGGAGSTYTINLTNEANFIYAGTPIPGWSVGTPDGDSTGYRLNTLFYETAENQFYTPYFGAWGAIFPNATLPNGTYTDITITNSPFTMTIVNDAVTYAKMQNISTTQRVLGRNTAGAGDTEEVSASGVLDWIGSTRGSLLYRGASGWAALTPGTSGYVLTSAGAGADPAWVAASGGGGAPTTAQYVTLALDGTLTAERVLAVGSALSLIDGGAGGNVTLDRAALTGDVTASAGSNATTIANDAVTYAKMQNISTTQRVLGRNTAGAGDAEEVSASSVLDWIGSTRGAIFYRGASGWAELTPGTSGYVLTSSGAGADPAWAAAASGGAPTSAQYVTLALDGTLTAERVLAVGSGLSLADGGAGGNVTLDRAALTGDVTASAGSNATTIANDAVTYAKMQNISTTQRVLGRNTAGAGDTEEVSASGVLDWIGSTQGQILYRGASGWTVLATGTSGQVLQTGGAAANPSWADASPVSATYVTISSNATLTNERTLAVGSGLSLTDGGANSTVTIDRAALTGDVTASAGSNATTIANDAVTYAKIQNISTTQRVLGRNTTGAGDTEEVSASSVLDWIGSTQGQILYRGASGWAVLAPGTSGQVLQTGGAAANPSWTTVSGGSGTVTSVGLSLPSIFSVSGSPVTTSGTLTGTLATQSANLVFAGPSSGAAAAPTFRSLVVADLPIAQTLLNAKYATTTNITLSGTQTIDSATPSIGDWILVKNQTTASENGVYAYSSSAWTRVAPMGTGIDVGGYVVTVHAQGIGGVNGDTIWQCTSDTGVIGTNNITFTQIASGGSVSDGDKGDITVSSSGTVWTIDNDVVTYAKMQNVSATQRVLGRNTAGAGDTEEVTASQVLSWISSTQGDVLYHNGTSWVALGAGTSGQFLQTGGTGANPSWASASSSALFVQTADGTCGNTTTETAITSTGTGSLTLGANTMTAGSNYKLVMRGYFKASSDTLTLKVKLGSTVVATTGAVFINTSSNNMTWEAIVDITVRTAGASGTVYAFGYNNRTNGTGAVSACAMTGSTINSTTTIDTTSSQAVSATATWVTASANNSITCTNCILTKM